MSGYQFAHIDSYSNARPKSKTKKGKVTSTKKTKFSAADILAEVARLKGNCNHVLHPQPPNWCYGSKKDVEEAGKKWAKGTKNASITGERSVRSDAVWLAAGVISLPADRISEWPTFRDFTIKELKKKYGDRLRAVVEHLDEPNPHLHFYAVPHPGESFGAVHEGYKAKNEARKLGLGKTGTAFVNAMKSFQDEIYEKIGKFFSLSRFGPKRTRDTREVWQARQLKAELAGEANMVALKIEKAKAEAIEIAMNASAKAAEVLINAEKESNQIVDLAKAKAAKVEVEEEERVRKKSSMYFKSVRKSARDQNKIDRQAARNEDAGALNKASETLRSSAIYHELNDMRASIEAAEIANKNGKFAEAAKHIAAAKAKDPAPGIAGPKIR